MEKKEILFTLTICLIVIMCICSFAMGFTLNRSKKNYDLNKVVFVPRSEKPKYDFLEPELSDYICALCDSLKLDSDIVVAHLLVENPEFNPDAIHINVNGTLDVGLFQLNDRYLWTTFKDDYWFENLELDPFNWKHNTYIAIHHIKYLQEKMKIQDAAIMAYNCGERAVMNDSIPETTKAYLSKVKINLALLQKGAEK
jgi:hypothetical protein